MSNLQAPVAGSASCRTGRPPCPQSGPLWWPPNSEPAYPRSKLGQFEVCTRTDETVLPVAFKFLKLLEKPPETYRRGYDKCCEAVVPVMHNVLQYFSSKVSS